MPVAVIGAAGAVGRALVPMLAARGGEVRAQAPDRAAAEALRTHGAKVAVGDPWDEELLWPLLQDAHTLCHVAADPLADDDDTERVNLGSVEVALAVAREAGPRRILFLSHVGASARSDNPTLRALGRAEDLVMDAGEERAVLRATHVVAPGSTWLAIISAMARRRPALVLGPGTQIVAPIAAQDVARVLAAADDRAEAVGGVLAVQGPDRWTADQVADLVAGRPRRWKRHVDRVPELGDHAARILAGDAVADAPDGCARFDVVPSSVALLLQGPGEGEG